MIFILQINFQIMLRYIKICTMPAIAIFFYYLLYWSKVWYISKKPWNFKKNCHMCVGTILSSLVLCCLFSTSSSVDYCRKTLIVFELTSGPLIVFNHYLSAFVGIIVYYQLKVWAWNCTTFIVKMANSFLYVIVFVVR